jgi:hypothetical protein
MKAVLVRTGAQASKYKVADLSWRDAFYTEAILERARLGDRMGCKLLVKVYPLCVDARGVSEPLSCVPALEQALEAAVAGGLIGDRRHAIEVRIHRFVAAGVDGLRVELTDEDEPF